MKEHLDFYNLCSWSVEGGYGLSFFLKEFALWGKGREAEEAFAKDEVPVGAVMVMNNKIIESQTICMVFLTNEWLLTPKYHFPLFA